MRNYHPIFSVTGNTALSVAGSLTLELRDFAALVRSPISTERSDFADLAGPRPFAGQDFADLAGPRDFAALAGPRDFDRPARPRFNVPPVDANPWKY